MFHQYTAIHRQDQDFTSDHINELYFIAPIGNLSNILQYGLLSHKRAKRMSPQHEDVSNSGVQDRRATTILERVLPNKHPRSIHRHAVLYLNPHNAMMANMKTQKKEVCVLRINKSILSRPDAIVSDKNAAVDGAHFFTREAYRLGFNKAQALSLPCSIAPRTTTDKREYQNIRQSEVLLPYAIHPSYIIGVIVGSGQDRTAVERILKASNTQIRITIVPSMFLLGRHSRIIPTLVDPTVIDSDTLIFVRKPSAITVFWNYVDHQGPKIHSRNITGKYKGAILDKIDETSWKSGFAIDKTDPKFDDLLYRCGANCPLESFSLITNVPQPVTGFPVSSDEEDAGTPRSIIRLGT